MTKTAPKPKPKSKPQPLRNIISQLDDRVKAALVRALVTAAKTDIRAAEIYARYSGEGGQMTPPVKRCCFSLNLVAAGIKEDDSEEYVNIPTERYEADDDEPEEESDEERRNRW